MSKAEERAKERYNIVRGDDTQETSGIDMQGSSDFIEGYRQAEEDLALTWEDIDWIVGEAVCRVSEDSEAEQICKEVLKRFKERKGK